MSSIATKHLLVQTEGKIQVLYINACVEMLYSAMKFLLREWRNYIIDHRNIYLSKKYHNLNKRLLAQKIFYKMFHLEKAKGDYTLHIKQEPKGR